MILLRLSLAALVCAAPASVATASPSDGSEGRLASLQGGRFQDTADSLDYDAYRELGHDDQLERRESAKRWSRRAREFGTEAGRQPEPAAVELWLRRGLDASATAVGLCPYFPEGWLLYANFSNMLGRYVDAELCLREAELTLPYDPGKSRQEELKRDLHRIRAVVAYNQADYETCLANTEAYLEIEESDEEVMLLEARALIALDRYTRARQVLARFDDRGPRYALSLSVLALLEMKAGRLEVAADAFDRAYKYGQRGAVFDNDRGRLYLEMGRYDDAIEAFESAIESVPGMMEARSNLAVAHRRAGNPTKAQEVLQQALEIRDDYAPAHFNLAEVLRERLDGVPESERPELAALAYAHYERALALGYDPATVMERRAGLSVLGEDLEQAEADLLRMTEDPDIDGRVVYLLARVKKEQGRLDIALNLLEMAEERGYAEAGLYAVRGEIHLRRGELEAARDDLRRATQLDRDLVVTRVNLSIALSQLGDLNGADAALSEAEALAPGHELVQNQRRALEQMRAQRPD